MGATGSASHGRLYAPLSNPRYSIRYLTDEPTLAPPSPAGLLFGCCWWTALAMCKIA